MTVAGLRVAHVNDIAFVASSMARLLRASGVDADLIEPWRPGARIAYPWKLGTLPFRAAGLLLVGARLRQGNYDLVHVHYARLGMLGPLSGRPYILHCHGSDIRGVIPGSAWGREVAPLLARAAAVYYATPDLRPWVQAFRPDAAFLPNPIDRPPPEVLALEPKRDLLVGVRLSAVKGLPAILAILRAVVAARPRTTVSVVEQGDGIRAALTAAGSHAVRLPPVPHASMPALLRAHRIAIGQQLVGTLGNYELETMAAGVPVAAAFRAEAAYSTAPPVIGGDGPDAVAARIVELLDDEPARLAVGREAAAWVSRHHAPADIAARLVEDYRRILSR